MPQDRTVRRVGGDEIAQRLGEHVGGEHGEAGGYETLRAPIRRVPGVGVAILQPQAPCQHEPGDEFDKRIEPPADEADRTRPDPDDDHHNALDGVPGDGQRGSAAAPR